MKLEQLQEEARKDLPITNEEDLASESLANQMVRAEYRDHRS